MRLSSFPRFARIAEIVALGQPLGRASPQARLVVHEQLNVAGFQVPREAQRIRQNRHPAVEDDRVHGSASKVPEMLCRGLFCG